MTRLVWIRRCLTTICCACGVATASAETVTLTFDNIGYNQFLPSYTERGFIITSLSPGGGHLHGGGSELDLHNHNGSSPYRIPRLDGNSFNFVAFDYWGAESFFVSDTGATFTIQNQSSPTFIMSPAFQDVRYIDWYMTVGADAGSDQWGSIDNIVLNVTAVPEPTQGTMLVLGLAGLLACARRSRR